jgi:hypothetical protein
MTDLTVTPAPISLTIGDTTYQPRDANAVVTLLDRASADPTTTAFVQKARKAEATGTLGLYIEAVAHTAHGTPFSHMKFFIVGTHVYSYNRSAGDARANWRGRNVASLADALMLVQAAIDKPAVKILGHPVLVELTPDDVSAVESGQLPPGRFRGQYRIERDFGRYDFEMDVRTAPMPPKLVKALSRKPWVVGPV